MKMRGRILALVVLLLALARFLSGPDGKLHVYFLATPGDAVLVQSPSGRFVLIDGGSDPALLALELGRRLPFWRRSLDAVVLTRPDGKRLPGQVAALTRYHTALALIPAVSGKGGSFARWRELLVAQRTPLLAARPGLRLPLGGAVLTVLANGGEEAGLALRLVYGRSTLLLASTLDERQERVLREATGLAHTTLAYLPWQREVDPALLSRLQPRAIVYADGYEARKPALLTYHARAASGSTLYHEQIDGCIELISDGSRAWIMTEP